MKLLSMARSLLFRKRSPGNLSMREDSVRNEYADYHQYCSVDYGDYSTVECTSANDTLPSQSTAPPPPDNINHLVLVNRSDGYLKFKALCGNRVISDVINTSNYSPFLCGSVVDFAEVTGVITDSFLLWLSAARVVTSLRIRDAKLVCRSAIFCSTIHRIALQSLSICRCLFSDAQELESCKNLYGNQLQILRIHRSYIHVISEASPKMYVFFYTSIERTPEMDDLE
ncbi:hypothetical protein Aduo_014562 [Ancylostoma duodenale]